MNVWLVTIGSSDVQLTDGGDDDWKDWYSDIKKSLHRLPFKPTKVSDEEELYRLPARVLGLAYEQLTDEVKPKLTLPLLQSFTTELKAKEVSIAQIIVLLSDQENLFDETERETKQCPYWQDTCQLYPILKDYFRQHFPQAEVEPLLLKPQAADKGIDDWDAVLGLVQRKITGLKFEPEPQTVYVSHQAGTPAISSAVQFSSLARFGDRVKFLVSNEQDASLTSIMASSAYLQGIKREQAKVLLKRYDYSGIRNLIGLDEFTLRSTELKRIKYLLDAAEQWNFAEFQKFKKIIINRSLLPHANFPWWRMGYESAYLAWVRLQQGSTVDAMVHSFRAVEGSASLWAEKIYQDHVRRDPKKGLQLNFSICNQLNLDSWFVKPNQQKKEIGAYGKALFALLREGCTQDWSKNLHIDIFCNPNSDNDIFEERNNLFHRLEGLQEQELFEAWGTVDADSWITRVLGCLNFISGQDYQFLPFEQKEISNEEASLMAKVHQQLESAIANL